MAAENLDDTMLKFGLGFGIFLFLLGLAIYAWGKRGDVEDSRYQANSVLDVVKNQSCLPKGFAPFPVNSVVENHQDLTGSKELKLKFDGRKIGPSYLGR